MARDAGACADAARLHPPYAGSGTGGREGRSRVAWLAETEQLLRNATWLDSSFGGEGRELLARAALGLGRDSSGVIQSRAAVRLAATR